MTKRVPQDTIKMADEQLWLADKIKINKNLHLISMFVIRTVYTVGRQSKDTLTE